MKTQRKAGTAGRRERRAFSAEFKAEAVRLVAERRALGVTAAQVGRERMREAVAVALGAAREEAPRRPQPRRARLLQGAELDTLPVGLDFDPPRIVRVDRRTDVELWIRPCLLVLALLCLALEWLLRQRSGYL